MGVLEQRRMGEHACGCKPRAADSRHQHPSDCSAHACAAPCEACEACEGGEACEACEGVRGVRV
eukprot:1192831-Rhodomonas_salina.1